MQIKRIAVLTSGGDAPGMNAAIRAVIRTGLDKGWITFGINYGYSGLLSHNIFPLGARDVGGIMHLGGTMLGSARCPEMRTEEGPKKALQALKQHNIDALVVIGGNGSQTGAYALSQLGIPVVGVASTIDNDLYGSDITIGVDTALNIALESIDRLKSTASSLHRAFLIEVMGRNCGYLALMAGIAGGAEAIVIPEAESTPEQIAMQMRNSYNRGKQHAIVVVSEGAQNNAEKLIQYFKEHKEHNDYDSDPGFDLRVTILGHVQRGGSPQAFDRLLATRLGAAATDCLSRGEAGVLVGWLNGKIGTTPLSEVANKTKQIDINLLKLANTLAL
ncbi:MAG: 6-phosphofructokinase [bacterium]|nr:MAG: 6-phosphofructokinase [bacterium]